MRDRSSISGGAYFTDDEEYIRVGCPARPLRTQKAIAWGFRTFLDPRRPLGKDTTQ